MAEEFEQENGLSEEDFAHFIGKKADKYLRKFKKFNVGGVDKFAVTWHWPAFFFGFLWMLYRKLYLWALVAFILDIAISSLPYYFVLPMIIVWGMTGNYIYYKHAKKKILKLKTDQPSFDLSLMAASLRKMGGVNRWVPYIPVIIIIAGIFAAIAIPQFSAYRMRSYNAAALADLTNACRAQEAHFVDNATYCDSIERLTGDYYGLYLSEDVTVYVESANKDHYLMVAFHEKGNKKYVIAGPDGGIRETEKTFSIADFDKAIEINPSDADAYYNRGVAYGHKGQHDKAISDYSKAIEINPRHAFAYYNRGLIYGKHKGQHEQAISDFTKAIEIDSRHADAYYNRGTAYGHKGQHDKAISDYSRAIGINPRYAEAYYKRGYSHGEKGQFDKAIADYSRAIEIDSRHADAYINRGFTYYTKGQFDKAIADYSKALEINPRHGLAYGNRIVAYIEKEEYEKAWDDVNKAQDLGLQMHPGILKALREASGRER